MTHVIRLRAAWTRAVEIREGEIQLGKAQGEVGDGLSGDSPQRFGLPDGLHGCSAGERLVYRRSFNTPTGIDSSTPLRLCIERWVGALQVALDEAVLWSGEWRDGASFPTTTAGLPHAEHGDGLAIDITGRLQRSHQLRLTLTPATVAPAAEDALDSRVGLTGIVWLEIEPG